MTYLSPFFKGQVVVHQRDNMFLSKFQIVVKLGIARGLPFDVRENFQ